MDEPESAITVRFHYWSVGGPNHDREELRENREGGVSMILVEGEGEDVSNILMFLYFRVHGDSGEVSVISVGFVISQSNGPTNPTEIKCSGVFVAVWGSGFGRMYCHFIHYIPSKLIWLCRVSEV